VTTRPRVFATHRQLTGIPYIHHAYVYVGNVVVASCTHKHGERRSVTSGAVTAQACAERMMRRFLRRPICNCINPTLTIGYCKTCGGRLE
jgi:hypothetical protein